MIRVNTSHINQDEPYRLDGNEPADMLGLQEFDNPVPMAAAGDVNYDFSCAMANGDLLVTGHAWFPLKTVCSRCMDDITVEIKTDNLCLHYPAVREQIVDITDDVREELLLAIPNYIFCSDDCKGVCFRCGANLNREACTCPEEEEEEDAPAELPEDSPWSSLDQLKFDK